MKFTPASPAASVYRRRNRVMASLMFTILLAGILLLTMGPWKADQKGELIRDDTEQPSNWTVHKGELIEVRATIEDYSIVASPIRGGATRTLYTVPRANHSIDAPTFTDTEIWLPVAENPVLPPPSKVTPTPTAISVEGASSAGGGAIVLPTKRRLGTFLPPEKASQIPQNAQQMPIHTQSPGMKFPPFRETLHRIPWDGSPVIQHTLEWKNTRRSFYSENATYALHSKESNDKRVILPNGDWFNILSPTYSLYVRPWMGGEERLVLSGLPYIAVGDFSESHTDYSVDKTGVYLKLVRPYPDTSSDLLRIPNPPGSPIRISNYQSTNFPVVYKERLWWLESKSTIEVPTGSTTNLISCRLDGTDRQTQSLENDADGKKVIPQQLHNCDGALMMLYQREETFQADGVSERILRNNCARLYPNRTEILSKPLRLPNSLSSFTPEHCYDGYFYYYVKEIRKAPLDFLQEMSTNRTFVFLARVRLPE